MAKEKDLVGKLMWITFHGPYSGGSHGVFGVVIDQYQGDVDLSHHGSPWYEDFIKVKDPCTGDEKDYGSQNCYWKEAGPYIEHLLDTFRKIKSQIPV